MSAYLVPDLAKPEIANSAAFKTDSRRVFSTISLITPSAALRRAKGSLDPVGFSSIAQNPTSVSILSASATATDTGSIGTRSAGPCGL